MRVPLPWLREYCDPPLDARQIEERLTMTGTKVEAIHVHGVPSADGFLVGLVLSAEQHPDADRLRVCTVDLGTGEPATIVCGAPNVAAGQSVAVACPGAVMPDGTKLGRAKLRGIVSEGMILAESELQIGAGGEGIMVLGAGAGAPAPAPGTPLGEVLDISMQVLELEITPNRPDCLGVYGVARELHAATGAALAPAPWLTDPGSAGELSAATVSVLCPELCPRFTARALEDVTIGPSPAWLKARLMAAGQRPINNVVDITNYVMLLTGQPLHAFDLDRVAGATLTVRRALAGEPVQTLDGQTRELDEQMIVIDDGDGPTSIAGIMGGARSEVEADSTRVLLEVATWHGPSIHRASWALALRSEASSRFEKGLAPEQCMHAQALACSLMIELCGARLLPGTIDVGGEPEPAPAIRLREARVERVLGVGVARERQIEILTALDFTAQPVEDGLAVSVPGERRQDVSREVDLIEEIARIDGLERLPATLPARRGAAGRLSHSQRVVRRAEDALVGRGLHEVVGWSFTEPALLEHLRLPQDHPLRRVVRVENPLSDSQSIMRPTLLGSLLDAARHNIARNGPDVGLFESGTVYRAAERGAGADEHHGLGAVVSGATPPRSWRGEPVQADFFTAKALLGGVLDSLHVQWHLEPAESPFLHPGRSAAVMLGEDRAGFVGELHPLVAAHWDIARTATFAVDLGRVAQATPAVATFSAFGAFPSLRQDIAVVLPAGVPAQAVIDRVREAAGRSLTDVEVFDVYAGAQVGEGRRSLALALTFSSAERTLTDEDISPLRERIVRALQQIGGELRG